MSQTVFLSSVSNEFGTLRRRLASLGQRTKKCHFRHQDDFFHRGVKTLQKLVEEIELSTVVLHIIGDQAGWSVPADQTNALLDQWPEFEKRFPEVATQARRGELPATQWEAWLGLLLGKRLLSFQLQSPTCEHLQHRHGQRLNALAEHPQVAEDIDALYDEMVGSLITLGIFTQADVQRPNNLPYRSLGELFIGREEFMIDLQRRLSKSATVVAAITTRPQTLFGAGGVGKTRTAIEYAWRNADHYTALLFLSAVSPAALTTSLANLVGVLGISGLETAADDVRLQAALDWLNAHSGWLAILDNVDDDEAAQAVKARLAALANGHVLITSRLSTWSGGVEKLELELLTSEAARNYLLQAAVQRTPRNDDDEQAQAVGLKVGLLALGLEHATAYINAGGLTFAEYLQRWDDDEASILTEFDLSQIDYPRELLVTWRMSVERLNAETRTLLEILSWLAPDPIVESTVDLLEKFGVAKPRSALNALVKFSLIKREAKDGFRHYTQHRLVQATTRYHQRFTPPKENQGELPQLESALAWMDAIYQGDPQDVHEWPKLDPLAPHALAVSQFAHQEKKTADKHATSRLLSDIALLFSIKARHLDAEPLMRRALAIDEQRVKQLSQLVTVSKSEIQSANSDVARDLNNLALLLQATNRLSEAEPLMARVVTIYESSFGKNYPNVGTALNNQAIMLQESNRLSEAEPLMIRAVKISEESYGENHPNVASALNNLALLLFATNRLSEAAPMMRRVLAIDEQFFGEVHPKVARDITSLAQLLQAINRLSEAEPLMRRALEIDEKSYGTDHPDVARDLNNLAELLRASNRLSEAEPLMRRALAIDEKIYGTEHPLVANRLNNLALLHHATNRMDKAETLMRRALAIYEQSYGSEHPTVATSLNNLGALLLELNRPLEAEPLVRRALAIDEQSYGAEHPEVTRDLSNLAELLRATNRLSEAESLMRRSLMNDERSYGPEHPRVSRDLNNLATLLQATNRLSEAEPLIRRALAIDEQSYGAEHPDVARDLNNLAQLLQDTGRQSEAEPLMASSLLIFYRSLGAENPITQTVRNNYQRLLQTMGLSDSEADAKIQSKLRGEA